jgi:hypothetical protein
MTQIPFYPVTNTLYMGVIENTGAEDMLHIMRPAAGYLAVGSTPVNVNGSGSGGTVTTKHGTNDPTPTPPVEDTLLLIMENTCIDYESNKTKANQSFVTNYPQGYYTVILSDYMPTAATTLSGSPMSFDEGGGK